ncbi:MAG: CpsD/CapB family tyrosine-protein kinase [Acidobacteriia bacterium]|nr:CpsD/CapB family tyrosine-protein kinase [Terriglobia bacterium]
MSRHYELLQRAAQEQALKSDASPLNEGPTDGPLPSLGPRSTPRQELLKLVHRLFLFGQSSGPRVIVFTGVGRHVGCSAVCAGAAEALAGQVADPICVVDANFRWPSLHKYFRSDNLRGLADALVKPGAIRSFAHRIRGGNLWLLSAGTVTASAGTLLSSQNLSLRIAELREEFRFILIDSSPVNENTDAILLGQLAEGVLLVLESNSTRREVARRAKESFESAEVSVVGAVLNKRNFPIPAFLYERV